MQEISLKDINLHDIGDTIQMAGSVWAGNGICFITPGPNSIEDFSDIKLLKLSIEDWKKLIRQADLMETEILARDDTGIIKVLYRKSQRQIDSVMQWNVFKRDNYTCRYCGRTGIPLTVDHVDLWEEGGATIPENLITACKKCNKDRGRMKYIEWLNSSTYKERSKNLSTDIKEENLEVTDYLDELKKKRVYHVRSR